MMTYTFRTTFRFLGALYILLALGCGQPRVYVITSTTVGLEATPPLSDGSGVPRVTVGYKRAEVALIPVCHVGEYKYSPKSDSIPGKVFTWIGSAFDFNPKTTNCQDTSQNKPGSTNGQNQSTDATGQQAASSGTREQSEVRQPSTLTQTRPDGPLTKRQDSYSTLGLFRLGLSWFGPAKIEQFVATGQAAIALQDLPTPPPKDQFIRPEQKDQKNQPDTNKQVDDKKAKTPEKKPAPAPTGSSSAAPAPPALESQEGTVTGQPTAPSGQPNP